MGFWTLLEVACMPIFQVLIISVLGALMATEYWNLLPLDARKSINKVVFVVFTPALVFSNVAKTITFGDIVSWWFMVVNIGLTFLVGGILGWIVVKIFKPKPYQEGVVIATVSSGNLGNLLLILVPAICNEDGNPFGDHSVCKTTGLAYVSFSMALGNFFIWTYSYQLIRTSSIRWKELQAAEETEEASKRRNTDLDADEETHLLKGEDEEQAAVVVSETSVNQAIVTPDESNMPFSHKVLEFFRQILHELLAPPTVAAIVGFFVGAITVIKNIIIGDDAPLHVIEDSITQLGNGTIPCITLILGGNLIQGLRKPTIKVPTLLGVIIAKYIVMPAIGIGIVTGADKLGLLPSNSLFHFVLMLQFTLPPAMNIGTMTQLYDVAEAECSVIFLWTYLVAALALTVWSTIFMWILS
ncbi:protein PIN-LIKES 5-like [Malus sylvestris]|uniref:protein PIN-LIKES 5-like n=1 Tax=Malus sylvestris TaxID=3752 RepID=UPI0021AD0836|nr:protein PIN-LIKES 5-like [Malus sylvestris]XP_050126187.1 protein PIN-LIKES 5-like [Malus sylvestris]